MCRGREERRAGGQARAEINATVASSSQQKNAGDFDFDCFFILIPYTVSQHQQCRDGKAEQSQEWEKTQWKGEAEHPEGILTTEKHQPTE
jgi:hypothetical protein